MHRWNHKKRRSNCQVWQLDEGSLLNDANVIYTFDFFHPWSYITNETGAVGKKQIQTCNSCPLLDPLQWSLLFVRQVGNGATYPGDYTCNDVFKGWVTDFVKKDVFLISYQVDKPRHLTAPGWQDVSWGAWKSFSHRRGILPQSASSVPTQIASNHICGPHQPNVHYLYLASITVISSLFFFVRRSDRFQYFATSGEWSTSYQIILAAANMFAT